MRKNGLFVINQSIQLTNLINLEKGGVMSAFVSRFFNFLIASIIGISLVPIILSAETYQIASSIDVTGPTSDAGIPYSKGIEDYCRYTNDMKLLGGDKINCTIKDDGYKNEVSKRNFEEFLDEEIVIFLSYATGANLMLKSDIEEEGVPTIPASTYSALLKGTKYFYLPISTYGEQLMGLAEYIIKNHKGSEKPKVGAFVHPSAFGRGPISTLKKGIAAGLGIELVEVAEHAQNLDNTAMLKRFSSKGIQYILSQTVQNPVAILLKDAKRLSLVADTFGQKGKITFMGAHYTGGNDLIGLAGGAAEGYHWVTSYLLTSKKSAGTDFILSTAKKYNRDKTIANSHNYTAGIMAAQIAVEAISRVKKSGKDVSRESIKDVLDNMNGNNSYNANTTVGAITFSDSDHNGVDALQIYKAKGNQFVYVDEPFKSEYFKKIK